MGHTVNDVAGTEWFGGFAVLLEDPSSELVPLTNFFSLFPLYCIGDVSTGQTDPPSWSLSLATSSVNPSAALFMSPDEKLQRKPKGKKKKRVCVLSNDWRMFLTVPLQFPPYFFFFLEILFEALSW